MSMSENKAKQDFYKKLLKQLGIKNRHFCTADREDNEEEEKSKKPLYINPTLKVSPFWDESDLKAKNLLGIIIEEARRKLSYYRQRKEDLIARMATEWPEWGYGMDFYTSYILPLLKNPLLLHFINLSDKIDLPKTNIKFGYGEDKDGNFDITWVDQVMEIVVKKKEREEKKDKIEFKADSVDLAIALSGDKINNQPFKLHHKNAKSLFVHSRGADLGIQAFYSFLEGILRNAAKHREEKNEVVMLELRIVYCEGEHMKENKFPDLNLRSDIDENHDYLICSVNTDRLKDKNNNTRTVKEGEEEVALIKFIDKNLNKKVIDDQEEITTGFWGLKELKICAAFVSGADMEKVNKEESDFIWVKKCPSAIWKDKDEKERMAFVLKMKRPKRLVVLTKEKQDDKKEWEKSGIKFITSDDLETGTKLNYDFMYIETKELENDFEINFKGSFPQRRVLPKKNDKLNLDDYSKDKADELLCDVYDLYLKECFKNNKYNMLLYFEDDVKAEQWKNLEGLNMPDSIEEDDFFIPTVTNWKNWSGFSNSNENNKIQYARHRGISGIKEEGHTTRKNKGLIFHQYLTYSDPFFSFLFSIDPNKASLGNLLSRQLIESAAFNVLIIDERIAQMASQMQIQDQGKEMLSLEEKLYWMGIYIGNSVSVTVNVNEDPEKFKINYSDIEMETNGMKNIDLDELLNNEEGEFCLESGFPIHLLLIHATKLNEIVEKVEIKDKETFVRQVKKKIPYVIVHSGRGKTKGDIPSNVPFLESSVVQRYLVQEPSKFFLTQIALAAADQNPGKQNHG